MKARRLRPWLLLLVAGLLVAALGLWRLWQLQTAPPPDPRTSRPNVPTWLKVSYLAADVPAIAPDLRVVRADDGASCFVVDKPADLARLTALRPTEENADSWRGVVLCVADQPALPLGTHAARAGDFYLFGDLQLIEKIKPAAAKTNYGPYRQGP